MPPHPPAPVAVITCFYVIIFHVSFTISAHTCFLRDSKRRVFTSFAFTFAHFATENVAFLGEHYTSFFSFFDLRVRAP